MQNLSRLALAAALALGAAGPVATPAAAQREAKPVKVSDAFRRVAGPAQKALNDAQTLDDAARAQRSAGNTAGADAETAKARQAYTAAMPLVQAMAPVAKSPEEQGYYGQFLLKAAVGIGDEAAQRQALDILIAANSDMPAQMAKYYFFAGDFAYRARDYAKAATNLQKAKELGYAAPELDAMIVDTYLASNQTAKGLEMAKAAIAARKAAGQPISEDLFTRPAMVLEKAGRRAEVAALLVDRVEYFPRGAYYDNAANMLLTQNLPDDAKLALYRLKMTGNFAAAGVDYAALAFAAAQSGLSQEAIDAAAAGRAKGGLNPSLTGEMSQLETQQRQRLSADSPAKVQASEGAARSAATGRVARATGDSWMNYREYDKAVAMYDLALQKGGADANGVMMAKGIALVKKGDKAGAEAVFAKVGAPYQEVARLWTLYVRNGVKG